MAKTEDPFLVEYHGNRYDIGKFLRNHPGGLNWVQGYKGKNIAAKMQDTVHSKAAVYLLREYKQGGRDDSTKTEDEDLEKLVDWSKPMLSQVASLGYRYSEWVSSPVDRELTLFKNPILEGLTITPWYLVPLVWTPVIIYFLFSGIATLTASREGLAIAPTVIGIGSGVLLWSLLEYSLHRFVFHIQPSGKSKLMIYIHFTIHGLHHKVPFDTRRLVFPPVPAAAIAYVCYKFFSLFFTAWFMDILFSGSLIGYVMYDMIHFYLHSGTPKENTYLYMLKRYHNQHHFAHHNSGFGISSVWWDKIFGTKIHLKKLTMSIRW